MARALFVYTTFPNIGVAKQIVKTLLEEKLIACANLREHLSMYRFKAKIEEEKEIGAILKTKLSLKDKLEKRLKELHPYEVPVIFKMEVDLNEEAFAWLCKETLNGEE